MRRAILAAIAALTIGAAPAVGYLDSSALPDSSRFVPPPPGPGSPAFAADLAAYREAERGTPAWRQAIDQLDPSSAAARRHVSCALGVTLDPATTPVTLRLLQRTLVDGDRAAGKAKQLYKRARPYAAAASAVTCDHSAKGAGSSPSYPSGYASAGWLWGLLLSRIVPERTNELLAFGAAVGDNRVACRVHYPSDVAAGRMVGSAVFAAELGNVDFMADMEAAKAEIMRARSAPAKGC